MQKVAKLFIVLNEGAALTASEAIAFCKKQLTGYKILRQVEFRTELPMTPVGKILRRELKDQEQTATLIF
jgi:long-chain acyl-CoA synthetase